jgi:hypothetical protein
MFFLSLFLVIPVLGFCFDNKKNNFFIWYLTLFLILIIIGTSYGLGVDYKLYNSSFNLLSEYSFIEFIKRYYNDEIFFFFPSWLLSLYSFDSSLVTFFTTFILLYGVNKLCLLFKSPYLTLTVSLYLIIVIGINYPRQAAAIGIFCLILFELLNKLHPSKLRIISLFFIAINFHKSSIIILLIMLLIFFLSNPLKNLKTKILFMLMSFLLCLIFSDYFISNTQTYLLNPHFNASEGSLIRLISYFVPFSLIMLFYKKLSQIEKIIFLTSFIMVVLCIFLNFFISTFVDRITLYLMPIQIICIIKLYTLCNSDFSKNLFYLLAVSYSFSFFYIWFVFSHHATYWHNYRSIFTL